jgi:hypothetical protein
MTRVLRAWAYFVRAATPVLSPSMRRILSSRPVRGFCGFSVFVMTRLTPDGSNSQGRSSESRSPRCPGEFGDFCWSGGPARASRMRGHVDLHKLPLVTLLDEAVGYSGEAPAASRQTLAALRALTATRRPARTGAPTPLPGGAHRLFARTAV